MFLFGVALWLEQYSLGRARRAVETLVELTPTLAHRLRPDDGVGASAGVEGRGADDAPRASAQPPYDDVAPEDIAVGDVLLVKPGERIAADGEVTAGRSSVNQSPVTGESTPVEKQSGDEVFAGSLNGEGMLYVRATKTFDASTLAHVARLVEQAQSARAPSERFIDQFAHRYTPTIIGLSLLVALGIPLASHFSLFGLTPMPREGWFDWIHRGLVLLVIACPCALVISTPITIVCGLHRATRYGVLVKGGRFLESAAALDGVAIDKTGTLTVGSPRVTGVIPVEGTSPDEVLRIAAALESHSEHPLGMAIVAAARAQGTRWSMASQFHALRGEGVEGTIDNRDYFVGSPRFFERRLRTRPPEELTRPRDGAATIVLVGTRDGVLGAIHLADQARGDAAQAIAELRDLGIRKVVMLTGDSAPVAGRIAHELGIDEFHSDLLPEEKVERVKALSAVCSNLAMVGDGVNDAPALAASRVGIALGSQSSDTALETADVVVLSPHVRRVPQLIRLARRTRSILWQNIGLALGIKVAVFVPATLGLATMWMAVAADVGASLLVIANGMRLLSGGEQDTGK
jgi:Cd2+/Zn2+-exporting ATPase